MSVTIHHLTGCAPAPLAHYLKALGILRLVAEQKDPSARLWWQDEHALLATTLDDEELRRFFLEVYEPSPIIAPWNAGSGFYSVKEAAEASDTESDDEETDASESQSGDDEPDQSDKKDMLATLAASTDARLQTLWKAVESAQRTECAQLRATLETARTAKKALNKDKKNEVLKEKSADADKAKKALKDVLVRNCFKTWRGVQLDWLLAGAIPTEDPKHPVFYPQHLGGSGGANGKLDFTNNYISAVLSVLPITNRQESHVLLETALLRKPHVEDQDCTKGRTTGMFQPNTIKAPNGSVGFSSERKSNPWELILAIEGTLLLQCGVSKKLNSTMSSFAVAPFSVESAASASGGGAVSGEKASAEQWLPIWQRPCTLPEVKQLFLEGRAVVGRSQSVRPVDIARSLGRLGTQRGVQGFMRYAYPQRNGKGHLAVALGPWLTEPNPGRNLSDASLDWINSLVRASNGKLAPASWKSAARRCEEALLATCRNGRDRSAWEELLLAMGAAEALLAQTPKKSAEVNLHPLRDLPAEWLDALPNTPELRLAVALAGQVGVKTDGHADYKQPVRIHFLPSTWDKNYKIWNFRTFADHAGPERVATTGDFLRDACAVVRRRLHSGSFVLCAGQGHYACLSDLAAFLRGEVDEARVSALARPLMALDWQDAPRLSFPPLTADDKGVLSLYGVLRLAHMPAPFEVRGTEYRVKTDPAIVQRLLSGDAASALSRAARRLTAVGLRPYVRTAVADTAFAQRLAAALIFPIHHESAAWLADTLCHCPTETHNNEEEEGDPA